MDYPGILGIPGRLGVLVAAQNAQHAYQDADRTQIVGRATATSGLERLPGRPLA